MVSVKKFYISLKKNACMGKSELNFKDNLPDEELFMLNNIRFTPREIDILVCLLNAKSTKKIASFLSIEPKTVRNHIHNIMMKLECNSRDSIIDFIEKSEEKLPLLKEHYTNLMIKVSFEQSLKEIAKIKRDVTFSCKIIYWTENGFNDSFVRNIQTHLKLAGFNVSLELRKSTPIFFELLSEPSKDTYKIYVLPKALIENLQTPIALSKAPSNYCLFLCLDSPTDADFFNKELSLPFLDLSRQENYFFALFALLKKIYPDCNVDKITTTFKDKYDKKNEDTSQTFSQPSLNKTKQKNFSFYQSWTFFLSISIFIALVGIGLSVFDWNQTNKEESSFRSDLMIPVESVFLNRPDLISQIDNAFKKSKEIQSVALVGIGGSGKTTLARQYAHQQKASVIWEINAETKGSLMESFANLAYALSKTEEDKKLLRDLAELKSPSEREKKIIEFIKAQLKLHSNWFLIYDNVEKFEDIQKFFPLDAKTWGLGKVILTTRDSNLQNNKYINHTLKIGELDENQKLSLLTKIMNQGTKNPFTSAQILEAKEFLEKIPPFPLDISTAAYYLKVTHISYKEYLENLENYHQDFAKIQEHLLKEAGSYINTRYGVISFSLEQLIKDHQDFGPLLLFVSLLDSQNIPIALLKTYKSDVVVDNFIYHLKKYSLITNDFSASSVPTFSIHRSTQDISLAYLTEFLKLNKDSQFSKEIAYALDDYLDKIVDQENFPQMQAMIQHIEKLLDYPNVLTAFSKGLLESKLGSVYYFSKNEKYKYIVENSLNILETNNTKNMTSEDILKLARSLLHIGAIYTELRHDKKAKEVLEKAVYLYRTGGPRNYTELSRALPYLGNVHRKLGNYEKARNLFEESLQLQTQYGANKKHMARTLAYLGSTYRGLGSYQKAIDTLKESLAFYKKHCSDDHFRVGWILIQLGNVYRDLGEPQKAKEFLEKGFHIFQKYLSNKHINIGLTLAYLGNCYRELGEYEDSRHYLEQSLKIYQQNVDSQHTKMGWLLFHLASTYKALGQHEEAQKLFEDVLKIYAKDCGEDNIERARLLGTMAKIYLEKELLNEAEESVKESLRILQSYHHVEAYIALNTLGEVLLKKSAQLFSAKKTQESQLLKAQAIGKFKEASKITKKYFPEESPSIQKTENRIKEIIKNIK